MNLLPAICYVSELPQWVISSDIAAYCPATQTIYIRNDQTWVTLLHEIGHHILCLCGFTAYINNRYDKLWCVVRTNIFGGRGGSWEYYSKYAIVVGIGRYAMLHHRYWRCSESRFYESENNKMTVLVAIVNNSWNIKDAQDHWEPNVIAAQNVLCTWAERNAYVKKEKKEHEEADIRQKEAKRVSEQQVDRINRDLSYLLKRGIDSLKVTISSNGYVSLPIAYLEGLTDTLYDCKQQLTECEEALESVREEYLKEHKSR